MKIRNIFNLFFGLLVVLAVFSCSKNTEASLSEALEKGDASNIEKIFDTIDEETLTKLTTENAAPESDFSYQLNRDETGVIITGYNGPGGLLIIPSTIEGYPVTRIEQLAFRENNSIEAVIIPNSVSGMGVGCFYMCTYLTSVLIPSKVSIIGAQAFFGCDSLSIIKIMPGVKKIGKQSFARCNALERVILPESMEEVCEAAFGECKNLIEVHLADTIKILGTGVFLRCNNLQSVNLPKNLIDLGVGCFKGCSELSDLAIPDEITKIEGLNFGSTYFQGCGKLPIATRKRLKELGYKGGF